MPETAPRLLDPEALGRYLDDRLPGTGSFEVERHRAGHSNETFFVRRSGHAWVLRRPPAGAFLPTAHDVLREHRVLDALKDTPVPTPRPVLSCQDRDVIGTPFHLMEMIEGHVLRDEVTAGLDPAAIGPALVDALADLHAVDPWAAGLEAWGRPDGYLHRQVRRWRGQLELTVPMTRPLPDLLAAADWLREHLPEASGPATIVHGDYKLDNVMLAPDPTRVAAILDWEMSTVGDPLADLGWMLSFWHQPGEPDDELGLAGPTAGPGFATRAELLDRYRERTGRAAHDLTPFRVLALWKLAILLEGSYARHLAGHTDDPFFARMETAVPALAARAVAVAGGG